MHQKLTPELAGKVIRADLKNIIDKVGAGRPLSGVERGIFDTLNLTTEDLGKKRQLSLLSKWANGKRLNKTELREISDLLPEGSVAEEIEEPAGGEPRRTGYLHEYKHYAAIYGAGLRTVKRWVERGGENNDPCPLDDADSLRHWWLRNQKNKCPDKLLAAAVRARRQSPLERPDPAPSTAPIGIESVAAPTLVADDAVKIGSWNLREVGADEIGLEATLKRLRHMEVQIHAQMEEALKEGNEAKATMALNMWNKITTQVRQVDKEARAEAESRGHLIPRIYAEKRIAEFHIPIQSGVRKLYRSMCEVAGLSIDAASEAQWNDVCDKLFKRFQEEVFAE